MPRDERGEIRDPAIAAIVGGRRAWTSARRLERRFGAAHMAALEKAEWVGRWSVDKDGLPLDRPAYTLTPWAAERLGVEIDERTERSGAEVPFWVAIGAASPNVVQPRSEHTVAMPHPQRVRDPGPGPLEYLIDLETGATTRELADAAPLLGVPVVVDPRLGPKAPRGRRDRAAAARRRKVGEVSGTDRTRTRKKGRKPT